MKTSINHFAAFVLVFLFTSGSLSGQNYQTVHFDREAYFESETFDIDNNGSSHCNPCRFGIRVDTTLSDSFNYVFPTYYYNDGINGDLQTRGSWLGGEVAFQPNGVEVFQNKLEEPIEIKTQAILQETWPMFLLPDNAFLEARVTNISYQEVLGQMDSVKTISIQAKDVNGENLDHTINDATIKIGQNLGFIETPDLYHFPNYNELRFLIGLTNPDLGEGILDTKKVFDFEVGDERHYIDEHDYNEIVFSKTIVIGKEYVNVDSVVYHIDRYEVRKISYMDYDQGITVTYFDEEIYSLVNGYNLTDYTFLNVHPYELISGSDNVTSYIGKDTNEQWFKEINNGPANSSVNWFKQHQKGLGVTKSYFRESPEVLEYECLVYYKKGSIEWGTPIDFVALVAAKEIQNPESFLSIYPNPSSNDITIKNKNSNKKLNHIEVFNNIGGKIADWPFNNQEFLTKSVEDFPPGMYWLVVKDKDEGLYRLSFIKR